ncbi:ankyrin repeat protein [Aspergillus vadensis CBS 113365]|uniref:Ankyrin repeat protein n=1 Tax=Aspergillus vadensis (strain CBS 113365 / IMI 142717 / IBT 24658) TaxID=1448311 RepID=A0A319B8M0_ASPVC|nr:ankyrin repeat protein [Aspergillus vadensis CBS 113365]PYH66730.1 ankyrin repeat protein [Aspergillus vadensis CBS 113365]
MTALRLPVELIEQIVGHLDCASDINALARTHGTFYRVVNRMLYRHDVHNNNSSALPWGIEHRCLVTVQKSLEAGASANECDRDTLWRPMALAVIEGDETIVRYLYEQGGVDIRHTRRWLNPRHEAYEKSSGSLLLLAAVHGHEALVRFFMDHLPRPYHVDYPADPDGRTPLMEAAAGGHLAIVRWLVDAGADIHARDHEKWTPLLLSAREGHLEVMQFLLQRGADPSIPMEPDGCFALCWAARLSHFECVRCLLDAGVLDQLTRCQGSDLPSSHHVTMCPLKSNAQFKCDNVVDLLFGRWDYLASTVELAQDGYPALRHAIPFEGIFRHLLAAGADPTAVDRPGDPLPAIVLASGRTALVQMMIDKGIDLPCHMDLANFLHQAIRGGPAVLDLLVRTGRWNSYIFPEHLDKTACEQALVIAASTGKIETLQWLLDRGFSVAQLSPTVNLIAEAACTAASDADATETIDLLLQHGLDINKRIQKNVDCETALAHVAYHYNLHMDSDTGRVRLRMLVDRGAYLLPPRSPSERYNPYTSTTAVCVGVSSVLDEMIFQEMEARRETWIAVEWLFQRAELHARDRWDWEGVKMIKRYSWRVRYPVPK